MPTYSTPSTPPLTARCIGAALVAAYISASAAQTPPNAPKANPQGISTQGITGGLVIPSAQVLSTGTLAFSYGNFQESQLGLSGTQQNFSFGVGLLNGLEFFGRFANYVDPIPGSILSSGQRDLSANIKFQLPLPWASAPKVALGLNDIAGGASFFRSGYIVASDNYGPFSATLGYAQGTGRVDDATQPPTFNGVFAGAAFHVGDTGLSLLAEHDGKQRHAGLRWHSPPITALGHAQIVGTVQQSFGAQTPAGLNVDATKFAVSLMVPLGDNQARLAALKPAQGKLLPPLDAKPATSTLKPALNATPEDSLMALRKALVAVGLERVRVGQRDGMLGPMVVVEYENNRYAHNEADALGLVLGLGAELAPKGSQRINAITLKGGLHLYETSVGITAFREFLRDGVATPVRDSLTWDRRGLDLGADLAYQADTRWIDVVPTRHSRVRVELKPELNYTLGTELGAFDYSLAANLGVKVPLWRGAQLQSSVIQQFANSPNAADGGFFGSLRQRNGIKSIALAQSFWINKDTLANVAVGRFHYDALGIQGEAMAFVPGTDNLLRARAAAYNQEPGGLIGQERTLAASYRHALTPTMSIEAGMQKYGDASYGPTVEWTRWFGDVSVQLFYRRGADRQFAGLQLSLPLSPRKGMAPGPVVFSGASQYAQSIRTRITTASESANLVQPSAVRDLSLESSLDIDQLNAGRMSQSYLASQAHRMREAFYLYATDAL
jgi:Exopolysaccharide biosynthesis protein YbjH